MIKEAHKNGIKVIFDLVCNHSSEEHPWFLKSKQNDAKALDLSSPRAVCLAMQSAAITLGLSTLKLHSCDSADLDEALSTWTQEWAQMHKRASP